jgi:hypothetical protein
MSGGFFRYFGQNMGDYFSHDFDAESTLSTQLRKHGDDIEEHGKTLSENTRGRVGHGPLGEVAETAVKRITGAFAEGFSGALKGFMHSTADIAEHNTKNLQNIERDTKTRHDSIQPDDGLYARVQSMIGGDLHTDLGPHWISDVRVGKKSVAEIEDDLDAALKDPKRSHRYQNYHPVPGGLWNYLKNHQDENGHRWPKNGGAVEGTTHEQTLAPGTILSRVGSDYGTYGSDLDVPVENIAVPPDHATEEDTEWEVMQHVTVTAGTVAPAFNQPGGATQYQTKEPFAVLAEKGYLRKVRK